MSNKAKSCVLNCSVFSRLKCEWKLCVWLKGGVGVGGGWWFVIISPAHTSTQNARSSPSMSSFCIPRITRRLLYLSVCGWARWLFHWADGLKEEDWRKSGWKKKKIYGKRTLDLTLDFRFELCFNLKSHPIPFFFFFGCSFPTCLGRFTAVILGGGNSLSHLAVWVM